MLIFLAIEKNLVILHMEMTEVMFHIRKFSKQCKQEAYSGLS